MTLLQDMVDACTKEGIPSSEAFVNYSVFMELCEGQKLWDVSWHCSVNLKMMYCTGKRSSDGPVITLIPMPTTKRFSMMDLERWQEELQTDKLTLAILEADTSIVFYDAMKGLVKPNFTPRKEKLVIPSQESQRKRLLIEALSREAKHS